MIIRLLRALVAQLDRALGYEPGGRGFDSLPARHLFSRIDGGRFLCFASRNVLRRGGRVAEGAPLLREYGLKAHRGFESLPLRHICKCLFYVSFQIHSNHLAHGGHSGWQRYESGTASGTLRYAKNISPIKLKHSKLNQLLRLARGTIWHLALQRLGNRF